MIFPICCALSLPSQRIQESIRNPPFAAICALESSDVAFVRMPPPLVPSDSAFAGWPAGTFVDSTGAPVVTPSLCAGLRSVTAAPEAPTPFQEVGGDDANW